MKTVNVVYLGPWESVGCALTPETTLLKMGVPTPLPEDVAKKLVEESDCFKIEKEKPKRLVEHDSGE